VCCRVYRPDVGAYDQRLDEDRNKDSVVYLVYHAPHLAEAALVQRDVDRQDEQREGDGPDYPDERVALGVMLCQHQRSVGDSEREAEHPGSDVKAVDARGLEHHVELAPCRPGDYLHEYQGEGVQREQAQRAERRVGEAAGREAHHEERQDERRHGEARGDRLHRPLVPYHERACVCHRDCLPAGPENGRCRLIFSKRPASPVTLLSRV
jgi:hypothetical protein